MLTVYKKFSVQHDVVVSALCCAAATSEVEELATPDLRITQLCNEFVDVFAEPGMLPDRDVTHYIVLQKDATLSKPRLYCMSPAERTAAQRQLEEFLEKGWIRASTSPYDALILFVGKADGRVRMCIDYRALNKQIRKYNYPILRIDNLLDRLLSTRYFSKLDLAQEYHQIAITPGHEHKTAFISIYEFFEFTVLPIGLSNAPCRFQRLINNFFKYDLDRFILVYLDDIQCIVLRWMSMQLI